MSDPVRFDNAGVRNHRNRTGMPDGAHRNAGFAAHFGSPRMNPRRVTHPPLGPVYGGRSFASGVMR